MSLRPFRDINRRKTKVIKVGDVKIEAKDPWKDNAFVEYDKLDEDTVIGWVKSKLGEEQVKSIEDFFSNQKNSDIIRSLMSVLSIENFKRTNKKGRFSNKNIMFTGGFEKMSRSEAKVLAEENGAKILGSVSKKLDYLVIGNSKPTKKKIDKAKELKIDLITEEKWYGLLNR